MSVLLHPNSLPAHPAYLHPHAPICILNPCVLPCLYVYSTGRHSKAYRFTPYCTSACSTDCILYSIYSTVHKTARYSPRFASCLEHDMAQRPVSRTLDATLALPLLRPRCVQPLSYLPHQTSTTPPFLFLHKYSKPLPDTPLLDAVGSVPKKPVYPRVPPCA